MKCNCGFCHGPTRGNIISFDEEKLVMEQWYPCNPSETSIYEYDGAYVKDIHYDWAENDDVIVEQVPLSAGSVSVESLFSAAFKNKK